MRFSQLSSLVAATALLAPQSALACGGFFCNTAEPVDQAGETVVFEVDEEAGSVTMHVEVEYEGPAESFAWVVPVKGQPDLFLSSDVLFDRLHDLTRPSYFPQYKEQGCKEYWSTAPSASEDSAFGTTQSDFDQGGYDYGVDVLDSGQVGAYETVTLSAESSEALVSWLQMNGFDVPNKLTEHLAPYVAGGQNFVALKLAKDADLGDLKPLGLRYEGTTPVIPLTLTAVAATPDMPLTVMLLGDSRAVPLNYLHVVLNPLAIDYWSNGSNLDDVIAQGADEAGGHGFTTQYALPLEAEGLVFREGMYDLESLQLATGAADFVERLQMSGFMGTSDVLEVLLDVVPVPEDFTGEATDFYNNPWAYAELYEQVDFDLDFAVDEVDARLVQPLRDAQDMLDRSPYLTRLRSSLSPEEMVLDPFFAFNPDLPPVAPSSSVVVERHCAAGLSKDAWEVPQRLIYPEGQTLMAPSQAELYDRNMTLFDYVQQQSGLAALYIQQMHVSGSPELLSDNSSQSLPQTASELDDGGSDEATAAGCGCQTGGAGWGWGALLGLGTLLARRRS